MELMALAKQRLEDLEREALSIRAAIHNAESQEQRRALIGMLARKKVERDYPVEVAL